MSDPNYEEMDEERLAEFLGTGGTGVLSLSRGSGESPYSVPVSFGYDPTEEHFLFRLAVGGDGKAEFLGGDATFVVYDVEGNRWESVVASGPLEAIEEVEVASGILESLRRVHVPLYDVFDRPAREVSFGFYRLDPETLTGRHSTRD